MNIQDCKPFIEFCEKHGVDLTFSVSKQGVTLRMYATMFDKVEACHTITWPEFTQARLDIIGDRVNQMLKAVLTSFPDLIHAAAGQEEPFIRIRGVS